MHRAHVHRLSVAKTEDAPRTEFSTTPPPRLQSKRGRRKLSAEIVNKEVQRLEDLIAADQDQTPTRSEEAEWEDDSQAKTPTAQDKAATQQGFIYPQPEAPPIKPKVKKEIRQEMARRAQARHKKEEPPQTHYEEFDEGAFGQRMLDAPPSNSRRRSLLSVELIREDGKTSDSDEPTQSQSRIVELKGEVEEASNDDEPTRSQSRISTAMQTRT